MENPTKTLYHMNGKSFYLYDTKLYYQDRFIIENVLDFRVFNDYRNFAYIDPKMVVYIFSIEEILKAYEYNYDRSKEVIYTPKLSFQMFDLDEFNSLEVIQHWEAIEITDKNPRKINILGKDIQMPFVYLSGEDLESPLILSKSDYNLIRQNCPKNLDLRVKKFVYEYFLLKNKKVGDYFPISLLNYKDKSNYINDIGIGQKIIINFENDIITFIGVGCYSKNLKLFIPEVAMGCIVEDVETGKVFNLRETIREFKVEIYKEFPNYKLREYFLHFKENDVQITYSTFEFKDGIPFYHGSKEKIIQLL